MAGTRDGEKNRDSYYRILNFSDKILTDRENAARSRGKSGSGERGGGREGGMEDCSK